MSGLDLPPLGGYDLNRFTRELRAALPGLQGREGVEPTAPEGPSLVRSPSTSFASSLADAIENVQSLQDETAQKTRGLALGEDVEIHDVLVAAGKSEVAFNLMLEVRNKLMDAWDRLSRSVS